MPEIGVASDARISVLDAEIAPFPEVATVVPSNDPSTSELVDVPSSTEEGERGVTVYDFESSSDIDPDEEKMFDEGLTRVEVKTDRSSRSIVIHLDCSLLTYTESVVPSLVPLCSSAENKTLQSIKDADLSLSVSGLALWVIWYLYFCPRTLCFSLFHFYWLFPLFWISLF